MLARSTIEQVKQYQDIVGLISSYVPLKKRGRSYLGLCPFHPEKTPSFTVSPERMSWYCFGCKENGDLIHFVRKIDDLSFVEAVRLIAQRANIPVIEEENPDYASPEDRDQDRVMQLLFEAREFFKVQLASYSPALGYLSDRGVLPDSIQQFHIGYAPNGFALIDEMAAKGFELNLLVKAGLVYINDNQRPVPHFRDRIMFPIIDYQGRTVGFGGRTLSSDPNIAKYKNTEDTIAFRKRKLFYGLYLAKKAIREQKCALLMEGYMDVIMAHQFGFSNAIASMGTALSIEQAKKLQRFTDTVIMSLDSDNAGQTAILKNFEVLRPLDFKVLVIELPHKDPADVLLTDGADVFQSILDKAISIIDFKLRKAIETHNINQAEDISKILNDLMPLLKKEADQIVQNIYVQKIAQKLNISQEIVLSKLKPVLYNANNWRIASENIKKDKYIKSEELLIYIAATNGDIRGQLKQELSPQLFINAENRGIYAAIIENDLPAEEVVGQLENPDYQATLRRILIEQEELHGNHYAAIEWTESLNTLRGYTKQQRIAEIKERIRQCEQIGDEIEIAQLQREFIILMQK